jgi:hypothetical protein
VLNTLIDGAANPVETKQLQAQLNGAAKRVEVRWGTFNLAGQKVFNNLCPLDPSEH